MVGPYEIPLEQRALLDEAQRGGFFSYAAGVAYQVLTHYRVRGLVIRNDRTDLPIKKGLSSSAAISVLTARAFNRVYDLRLTVRGEMELAYNGEITTPSRCGRMDQGCAFGDRAVLMEFDGDRLETAEVRPARELHFVIVDLKAKKDTVEILKRLNRAYPFAESERRARRAAAARADEQQDRRTRPPRPCAAGDAARLGALMSEAQLAFDRYAAPACPEELDAPVLHRVLAHPAVQPHVYGGKGVGSQGDGSAQFVARSAADQQAAVEVLERDLGVSCLTLTLGTGPSVRRALIPAAGFGTRLFPASKATKKELFPVIDKDGVAKPAILLIVEEALEAGIDEVVIVVQQDDLDDFESFFSTQISIENFNKLSPRSQEYARRILEIGRRVRFVTQAAQEGFGHAVYCAREALGDEPFLLMLGDHLYRSNGRGLLRAAAGRGVPAHRDERRRPAPHARGADPGVRHGDGRLAGAREADERHRVRGEADASTTRARTCACPGFPEHEYLTIFGQYVIKPRLFDYLEEHIRNNVRERGEFQLTSALDRLRQEDGFLGLRGRRAAASTSGCPSTTSRRCAPSRRAERDAARALLRLGRRVDERGARATRELAGWCSPGPAATPRRWPPPASQAGACRTRSAATRSPRSMRPPGAGPGCGRACRSPRAAASASSFPGAANRCCGRRRASCAGDRRPALRAHVELCLRLLRRCEPCELDASGLSPADTALVARAATACGVLFHGTVGRPPALPVAAARRGGLRERLFGARPPRRRGSPEPAANPASCFCSPKPERRPRSHRCSTRCGQKPRCCRWCCRSRHSAATRPSTAGRRPTRRSSACARCTRRCTARRRSPPPIATAVSLSPTWLPAISRRCCARTCRRSSGSWRKRCSCSSATRPATVLLRVEQRDQRRALGMAAHVSGVPWLVLERPSADEPCEPARSDFGPQPLAALPADDLAATVAAVCSAISGSVGAP